MNARNSQTVVRWTLLALAVVCLAWATLLHADTAQYIYDDLGRLAQVIDGQGNVATYNYDAVGNLLSITRNTGGVGAPTVTGITPNSGNAGASDGPALTLKKSACYSSEVPFFASCGIHVVPFLAGC